MNCIIVKTQAAKIKKIERAGRPTLHFNEQECAFEVGTDFPKPFKITLGEGEQPYPPGRYTFDIASFEVGDYESPRFGRDVKLVRLPDAPAASKA
jgi:hypothetical protein